MKALICMSCGASRWKEEGEYRVCLHCGTKFQKIIDETVRVQKVVIHDAIARQVDSVIALNDDVMRLLDKCKKDPKNAKKYANLILDIDPTNQDALKYLH